MSGLATEDQERNRVEVGRPTGSTASPWPWYSGENTCVCRCGRARRWCRGRRWSAARCARSAPARRRRPRWRVATRRRLRTACRRRSRRRRMRRRRRRDRAGGGTVLADESARSQELVSDGPTWPIPMTPSNGAPDPRFAHQPGVVTVALPCRPPAGGRRMPEPAWPCNSRLSGPTPARSRAPGHRPRRGSGRDHGPARSVGCGKTTLLRSIAGLETTRAGTIEHRRLRGERRRGACRPRAPGRHGLPGRCPVPPPVR